ncbi:hypothetical protein [Flavobacterium difficile]|uniref:Lipoprotein n=1 Tax=Flavobacterium difficile TaxID=2709659 RepID=A0ABX0IBD4_9FLAO|nr:hypothetical protein [Flavobacterium difficile]NHM02710.1 hypothetical protein [Flavobacterium difficile]
MKKIIAFFSILFVLISCTPESSNPKVRFELLPIESVVLPTSFNVNEVNEIEVNFLRPTTCHGFDGFLYEKDGLTRTIAVQSFVSEQNNCEALTNQIVTQKLNFKPIQTGTYLLKFFKGTNANGSLIFEEVSVDVQ